MNIRSKLALGLSISTVMIGTPFRRSWPLLAGALILLPLVWLLLIKRRRQAAIYVIILFLSHIDHIPALAPLAAHLPWPILLFLTLLQYLLPGMTIGFLIVQTTNMSEYINGLRRMHIPTNIALATSVIFRFIPTIRAENAGIKRAMRMRGLTGLKALRHPLQSLNYRLAPLLLTTSRIGDELSMASLCRGLSASRKRTSYESDRLRSSDWLIIALCALLILLWMIALLIAPGK
jgi:energy-coupling factor transporter transmembrane protein EcfT